METLEKDSDNFGVGCERHEKSISAQHISELELYRVPNWYAINGSCIVSFPTRILLLIKNKTQY